MLQNKKRYFNWVKKELDSYFEDRKNVQAFLFGSGIQQEIFGDIDIGLLGNVQEKDISALKERFTQSTFPYFVDLVDFNTVNENFKENVLNNKILWIKR